MKTKIKIFVMAIAMLLITLGVNAQNTDKNSWSVGGYVLAIDGQVIPTAEIYARHQFNDKWAIATFALVSNSWGEAFIGFEYSPTSWLVLGFSGGLEVNTSTYWRTLTTLLVLTDKVDFINFFEYGAGGINECLFESRLMYKPASWCSVGLVAKRFHGVGIRTDFSIPKTPLTLWVAPLYTQGEFLAGPEQGVFGGMGGFYLAF